eukprot:Clim_evm56s157 gene=Clim_evmTU56s157
MGRTKPLSLEEKRKRMMEILFDYREVFKLPELEKKGHKEKGVVAQSVKDVLQTLVDDNLINLEKIGNGNYYWAFPSQGSHIRKRRAAELDTQLEERKQRKIELTKEREELEHGREETDEYNDLLEEVSKLDNEFKELTREMDSLKDRDPELMEKRVKAMKECVNAANRWTDNIFNMKDWILKKFPQFTDAELNKNFEIPDEFDYIVAA